MFKLSSVVYFGIALMGLGSALWAQDKLLNGDGSHIAPIYVGAEAMTSGAMFLRETPPTGVAGWYVKGDKIGLLRVGEKVRISDVKDYPSLLGTQSWIEVERLDPDAEPKLGWVYSAEGYFVDVPPEELSGAN